MCGMPLAGVRGTMNVGEEDARPILNSVTVAGWWLLGGVAVLVIGVLLEGRRQARRYGAPSNRPNLLGAGMLEVQRHLQADRHVEVLERQNKGEETEVEGQRTGTGAPGSGAKVPKLH